MPLPVIAGTFRCTFNWVTNTSQTAANVFHVHKPGGNASDAFAAIDAAIDRLMWSQVSGNAKIDSIDILELDGVSSTTTHPVTNTKYQGDGGLVDWIPAVAQVVSLKTGLRGPHRRGRLYLPFVGEASNANGSLGSVSATQTAWAGFITNVAASLYPLCVASYVHADMALVSQVLVESVAGTQRRRQSRLR